MIASVLSSDQENNGDVLALTGASAALMLSNIPFPSAIAGVRVAHIDGQFVVNPTYKELEESKLDLVLAGTKSGIVMVECGAEAISESFVLDAIMFGHENIKKLVEAQEKLQAAVRPTKIEVSTKPLDAAIGSRVQQRVVLMSWYATT